MYRYLLLILALSLYSCEEDPCQTCTVIIEDNFNAADRECLGLPSDYPYGYEVFTEWTDVYCDYEIDELFLREGEVFEPFCQGVIASTITWVICE